MRKGELGTMQIIVRVAAGIVVGLVVFAAGCSTILSGATSDAMGGLPTALVRSGGQVAE